MTKNWRQDEEYVAALAEAQCLLGSVQIGTGSRPSPELTRKIDRALVQLVAVELRVGERTMGAYLKRPEHLPEDDRELHALAYSMNAKDRALRADALEWVGINRQVVSTNSFALQTPMRAIQKAKNLLVSATSPTDQDEARAWIKEISTYIRVTFQIEPDTAPKDEEDMLRWCWIKMNERNPVPDWMTAGDEPKCRPRSEPAVASFDEALERAGDRRNDDQGEESDL